MRCLCDLWYSVGIHCIRELLVFVFCFCFYYPIVSHCTKFVFQNRYELEVIYILFFFFSFNIIKLKEIASKFSLFFNRLATFRRKKSHPPDPNGAFWFFINKDANVMPSLVTTFLSCRLTKNFSNSLIIHKENTEESHV